VCALIVCGVFVSSLCFVVEIMVWFWDLGGDVCLDIVLVVKDLCVLWS